MSDIIYWIYIHFLVILQIYSGWHRTDTYNYNTAYKHYNTNTNKLDKTQLTTYTHKLQQRFLKGMYFIPQEKRRIQQAKNEWNGPDIVSIWSSLKYQTMNVGRVKCCTVGQLNYSLVHLTLLWMKVNVLVPMYHSYRYTFFIFMHRKS